MIEKEKGRAGGRLRWPRPKTLAAAGAAAGLVLLLLWMQGTLGRHRIGPEDERGVEAAPVPEGATIVRVEERTLPRAVEVPGSIRSRTEVSLAPRIQAAVVEVAVRAGDTVRKGDVLARLDDRDVVARVEQAEAALRGAEAEAERAAKDAERMESLAAEKAATPQHVEGARAAARAAQAGVERAKRARDEAQVFRDEAVVRAPRDAVVAERRAEPGDLAMPGAPLFVLYDPRALRVEAAVEESLATGIRPGTRLAARLEGSSETVSLAVDEVVPTADPRTRTVLVKAAIVDPGGLRPGAFVRLLVPSGTDETVLAVPAGAIRRVGQLETARLVTGATVREVSVRIGRTLPGAEPASGEWVEILAGLRPGESVLVLKDGAAR